MIPEEIRQNLDSWFSKEVSPSTYIKSLTAVTGGSINEAFRIDTTSGTFFIKFNLAKKFPGMFGAEKRGLEILREANCIQVPEVLTFAETGRYAYLILEYISSREPVKDFWQIFGQQLASMHRKTSGVFGLDHNNYIGSLAQSNKNHENWIEFLVSERLDPLAKMAFEDGKFHKADIRQIEKLYNKLESLLPVENPSLLHGDLWNGNMMTGKDGNPCIFDPAVYFGHRETDIAMTRLFGGFPDSFYESYNHWWPLETGWKERIPLNQLYPLLVHVNLFGGGYMSQVKQIVAKFV
ncbi:MAG: fructosamine kinase family protein [Lentimicrobium sp.]|nr:fructosamine kinase family protein [Lentimicrobium sp.]